MEKYLLIKTIKYLQYIFIISIYFYNFTHILFANPEKGKIISLLEGRHWILNTDEFLKLGDGVEEVLIDIWKSQLGINEIGRKGDFFLLGGHRCPLYSFWRSFLYEF